MGDHRGEWLLPLRRRLDGPTRAARDVLASMLRCFEQIGALPPSAVRDGEGCIGQWRRGKVLTEDFERFRGALGIGVRLCKPNDPEAKGIVERAHHYFETSFLPGRRFQDVGDFNAVAQEGQPAGARHGESRAGRGDI